MSAVILDGKALAASIKKDLTARTSALKASGKVPGLGTILVGDDPGSHSYVSGKHRDCQEVGITSLRVDLPESATQSDVMAAIKDLNSASECTGYIVQLPLPKGLDSNRVLELMDPAKDADGLHPVNLGRLVLGVEAPLLALVALAFPSLLAGAYAGIEAADPGAVDAARAVGMSEWQVVTRVEVPLGASVLIGGIRAATLQVVATATLAAYISDTGLGRYLFSGLKSRDYAQMLAGALLVAALALLLDLLMAALQRASSPTQGKVPS